MGGVILFFLVAGAVVVLLSPAMQARGRRSRDDVEQSAHEAVMRRLEDHSRRKNREIDPSARDDREPGGPG